MALNWSWDLQIYLSGAWTSVTRDVVKLENITAKAGIDGSGVTDCVADVGSISFTLDNSEANSAGLLGYYAPGHANCRAGFAKGALVRLRINWVSGGLNIKYFLRSRIETIEPQAGQFKERTTSVYATDFMQVMVENKTERLAVQTNQRFDQLMDALVSNSPVAPLATSYAIDPSTTPMAFHLERDESNSLMNVAQKICQSTLGKLYVRSDGSGGELLVYESRYTRALTPLASTLDNSMTDIKVEWKTGSTYGAVKASVYPYATDAELTDTLAVLESEISINVGETATVELRLRDPAGNSRVSGFDFVTALDSALDYRVSAISGSSSDDMNGVVTISIDAGSNTVMASITNNGAVKAYVNYLQVRCKGIYPYDVIDFNFGSGNRVLQYSMPYLSNANLGKSIGQAVYNDVSMDLPEVSGVTFFADSNSTTMGWLMYLDIGSRIALVEEATGLNDEFFINGYELVIENNTIKVTWILAYANIGANFFVLDDATQGVLDNTTYRLAI